MYAIRSYYVRHTKVCPFADNFHTQLVRTNANGIVCTVTHFGIGFPVRIHIGADTAKPQKVCLRFQQGMDQLIRRDGFGVQARERLDFIAQPNRFGRALENTAAL